MAAATHPERPSVPPPSLAAAPPSASGKRRSRPLRNRFLRIFSGVAPFLISGVLRLVAMTLRIRYVNGDDLFSRWARGEQLIIAFWHNRVVVMPIAARGHKLCIMNSQSRDGEIATRALARWGIRSVRGSATRGGAGGFLQLVNAYRGGYSLAVVPDGPRGPRYVVKPGVIHLARATGATIYPVTYAASRCRRLRSWDRLVVPLPFSRVLYIAGAPLDVPRDSSEEDVEAFRAELESRLRAITAAADAQMGGRTDAEPVRSGDGMMTGEKSEPALVAAARPLPLSDWLSGAAYDLLGNLLGLAAVPLLPLLLLTRHGRSLGERLGRLPAALRRVHRPLWVHAASVGEVLAAAPLIERLHRQWPDVPIVVSTTSLTGRETARARLAVDAVMLLPIDLGWIVGRVMQKLRPRCLVIVETEIWPALLRTAARQGIPSLIVSGCISERSAGRYAWVRWLIRPVLAQVSAFAMQTDADAARIIALGAPPARVEVLGNLKFARTEPDGVAAPLAAMLTGRTVLIAASTHADEESMVLDACAGLWAAHPDMLLLLAPRRPERFDEVDRLLVAASLRRERCSQMTGPVSATTQVLLLDTVGELPNLLPAARAVFVGGTIAPVGGHNVLEPAVFQKPVAFGPHTTNVTAVAQALLGAGAATRVRDAGELRAEWQRLLADSREADDMGVRGRAVAVARAAVADRIAELVRRHVVAE